MWPFYFSNITFLEFLEKHRNKFYLLISILLAVVLVTLIYFFRFEKSIATIIEIILLTIVFINYINLIAKDKQKWMRSQILVTIAPVINPKINFHLSDLFKPNKVQGALFCIIIGGTLLFVWSTRSAGDFPSLQDFIQKHGSESFLKTLWQIDAAVVTVTFISVTFIFEMLRSGESIAAKSFSFILNKLHYKEILVFNLFMLLPLGVFTLADKDGNSLTTVFSGLSLWIFVITIVTTIYLILRLIQLVEPVERIRATSKALTDKIRNAVIDEVFDRLAGNLLMNKGEKSEFIGFGHDFREELYPIKINVKKRMVIVDIKVDAIPVIVSKLKKTISNKGEKLTISKRIGSWVEPGDNVIARLHKDDYSKKIEKQIAALFKVAPYEPDEKEDVGETFDLVRDEAVTSIKNGVKSNLQMSLENFYLALEIIFDSLSRLGAKFDFKSSREPFVELRSMRLIQSNLREVIDEALKVKNKDIIIDVLAFPVRIMQLALDHQDHLIFKIAVHLYSYTYFAYKQYYDLDNDLIIDRTWRHLKEFVDYQLNHRFNGLMETDEGKHLVEGYITEILLVFEQLIKSAIDKSDSKAFKEFKNGFDKMFNYLTRDFDNGRYDIRFLKLDFEREKDENLKAKIKEQLIFAERIASIRATIAEHKSNIRFGLGAWMLRQTVTSRIDNKFAANNLPSFYSFGSFKDLYEIYFRIDKRKIGSVYGWGWWETGQFSDEEAHFVDDSWLDEFYCVVALKTVNNSEITNAAVVPSQDEKGYYSSNSLNYIREQLEKIFTKIKVNFDQYKDILTEEDMQKVPMILQAHDRGVAVKKADEEQKVRVAELNEEAVKKFKEEFMKAWRVNANIRKLFEDKGAFEDKTGEITRAKKPEGFGFNRLEPKELFIADVNEGYHGFGENYGSSMGRSEDFRLIQQMMTDIKLKVKVNIEEIDKEMQSRIKGMKAAGYPVDAILISGWHITEAIKHNKKFIPRWQLQESEFNKELDGLYDGIPVIQVTGPEKQRFSILMNIRKFGTVQQLRMDKATTEFFKFEVKQFSKAEFDKMVKNDPSVLTDKSTGQKKSADEVFDAFRLRAHIQVFEHVRFNLQDTKAATLIEVIEKNDIE